MGQFCCQESNKSKNTEQTNDSDSELLAEKSLHELEALNSIAQFSPYNLNKFITKLYLKGLPDDLKSLCNKYLGKLDQIDLQYPFNSNILITKEKYALLKIVRKHLKHKSIAFNLLYRATQDGYTSDKYHSKCDNHKHTIYIIETLSNTQKNKLPVFGGFTSINITNTNKQYRDENMFLFRIRAFPKLNQPNIYHSENTFHYQAKNYVTTYESECIAFGSKERNYLFISDRLDWRQNYVGNDYLTKWMEHTVGNIPNKDKLYFRIKEMEVFQVEQLG
eukprot:116197_1